MTGEKPGFPDCVEAEVTSGAITTKRGVNTRGCWRLTTRSSLRWAAAMDFINRLLSTSALVLALGGSLLLFIHVRDSIRGEEMLASLMTLQRGCACQGAPPAHAGFTSQPCHGRKKVGEGSGSI